MTLSKREAGMSKAHMIVLAGFSLAIGTAWAQDATYAVRLLTPETALKAARAALVKCRSDGYQVTVAVVDRAGVTQVVLRDRFAGAHTVRVAGGRAGTAG